MPNKPTPREQYIFALELSERARNEPTAFGKILFLENIISHSIVATLNTIALYYNHNERSALLRMDFIIDVFDGSRVPTLGNLVGVLSTFLTQEPSLDQKLKSFVTSRNKLTHRMLSTYKNLGELDNDSESIVKEAEDILDSLDVLRKRIRSGLELVDPGALTGSQEGR